MGAFRWVALVVGTALGTLAGDGGWRLTRRAAPGLLEGYAGVASVEHGESVDLHVRAAAAHTVTWCLDRTGWYGGAEARLVAEGGPAPVSLALGSIGPGGGAEPTGGGGSGGSTATAPRSSGCASAGDWATLLAPPLVLWLLRPRRRERERERLARRASPARSAAAAPRTFDTAWLEPGQQAAGSKVSG